MAAKAKSYLYGKVDADGRLSFDDAAAFAKVRSLLRGQFVQVLIEPKRKPRSLAENGYYWGVVIQLLCEWSGYSRDEMHDALREKFLAAYDEGRGLSKLSSTADLDTAGFEKYLSDIRQWASEQGVFIPLPNEEIY